MQNQNRSCGFRLRRTVCRKSPAFCASPKRVLFLSPVSASFRSVCISSFTGRRPDHMRGEKAVCVLMRQSWRSVLVCHFSDGVLCAHILRAPACEGGHNMRFGKKGRDGRVKSECLVLAQQAELFTEPEGVSREPLAVPPAQIVKQMMSELRASVDEAVCALPPSSVITDNGKPGCISVGRQN